MQWDHPWLSGGMKYEYIWNRGVQNAGLEDATNNIFLHNCVVDDECNFGVFTSSGVWHRRSKSIMEWIKSHFIRYTTADNEDNRDCSVLFCNLYEVTHDVMILWPTRHNNYLIDQKTNNNKPSNHQRIIHRCDVNDKQCKYTSLAS